jgi:exonuclease VII large subunit
MDIELAAGMNIVLTGTIEYWTEGGSLRLKVFDGIAVGNGDRTTATDELEAELGAHGWFDETAVFNHPT